MTLRVAPAAGFLALLALAADPVRGQAAQAGPAPPIGVIEVVGREVFDDRGGGLFAPHRIANRVHVRTRDHVIRRELLFETGDPLDPELLEQTERNLRGLWFLRDARVEAVEVDEDRDGRPERVDVFVTTWDRWSLAPRLDFSRVQNRTIWELGAAEKNFLGFGKAITASHRRNLDRATDRVRYQDPQLLGSNAGLAASIAGLSDGHERLLTVSRGYLSLRDPWAFSAGVVSIARTEPIVERGVEIDRLPLTGRFVDLEAGRALVRGARHAVRAHGAYRSHEVLVRGDLRDYAGPEVGLRAVTHRFVRLTHVNRFERTEDFNLGSESHAVARLSAPAFGGREALFLSLGHRQGARIRGDHFVFVGGGFDGRREGGGWRNTVAAVRARYLLKHSPRTALIGKLGYAHGHALDPEVQLRLGAESGLRGYPVRQFTGTRSLLLTLEERAFFADDVWQLFSFGVAAFVDSGFVWPAGRPVDLGDLRTGAGVSLLVGSHRLASRGGVRFDLGYALDPVAGPDGRPKRWVGAAFSDITF